MKEAKYQSKIMKELEAFGGKAINGQYSKPGEADIQGGYPINGNLYYIAIEVKTEHNYNRVMSCLEIEEGLYRIVNNTKLKKHEALQVFKLNQIRKLGGLALFAYKFSQIQEYVNEVRY